MGKVLEMLVDAIFAQIWVIGLCVRGGAKLPYASVIISDVIFLRLLLNCWPEVDGNVWARKVGEKISAAADGISPCSGNLRQRSLE